MKQISSPEYEPYFSGEFKLAIKILIMVIVIFFLPYIYGLIFGPTISVEIVDKDLRPINLSYHAVMIAEDKSHGMTLGGKTEGVSLFKKGDYRIIVWIGRINTRPPFTALTSGPRPEDVDELLYDKIVAVDEYRKDFSIVLDNVEVTEYTYKINNNIYKIKR